MVRRGGQTSVELRKLIISYYQEGKSFREIGKIVHLSHSTVQNIITRFRQGNRIANKAKQSKRKIFSESDERWLRLQIKKNPMLSAPKLVKEAEISLTKKACAETVRRVLRKENLYGRNNTSLGYEFDREHSGTLFTMNFQHEEDLMASTQIKTEPQDVENEIKTNTAECDEASVGNVEQIDIKPSLHFLATTDIKSEDVGNEIKPYTEERDKSSVGNVEHVDIKPFPPYTANVDIKSEFDKNKSLDIFQDDKPQDGLKNAGEHTIIQERHETYSEDDKLDRPQCNLEENSSTTCKNSLNNITPLSKACTQDKDKRVKCKICGKSFQKAIFATHMHLHAGKASIMCSLCTKSFVDQYAFDTHLCTERGEKPLKYRCYLCDKLFVYKSECDKHLRTHTKEKPFKCDHCSKSFSYKSGLSRHTLIHTGEKPFTCDYCGRSFSRKHNLMEHTTTHMEEKPYTCEFCSKTFSKKSKVVEHIRVHTGEKPFVCDICNKSYRRKSHLDEHLQTHSDDKHFTCNICSKQFYKKSILNAHMLIHSGEKRFTCNICNLSFSRKANLNSHMHIHKVL